MSKAINYRGEAITEFIFETAPAHRELKTLYQAASHSRAQDMQDSMKVSKDADRMTRESFDLLESEMKRIDETGAEVHAKTVADFQKTGRVAPVGYEGLDLEAPDVAAEFAADLNAMEGNMTTFAARMKAMDLDPGTGATIEEDLEATLGGPDPEKRAAALGILKDMRQEQNSIIEGSKKEAGIRQEIVDGLNVERDTLRENLIPLRKRRNAERKGVEDIKKRLKAGETISDSEQKRVDNWDKINKKVGKYEREQRGINADLTEHNTRIKEIGEEWDEAERKVSDLNQTIEKGINLDRTLGSQERKSNRERAKAGREHQERLQKIRQEMKKNENVIRMRNQLTKEFVQQLDAVQTSFSTTVTQSIAVAGAAFMALKMKMDQVIGTFQEFEKQLINAQSIFQTSQDTLFGLSDQIVEFGTQYGISLDNAAEGLYQFASAGLSAAESQMVLQDTLKLAMAVNGDHNTIAKLTTQTIFGFGLEMSDSAALTDKFAHAINKSLIEYQDLASAVKFAMPFFVSTGQSVDQLLGSLQVLTNRALEAGIAGRGLRQALAEFAQHAEDNTAAFAKMGIQIVNANGEFKQLTEIAKDFQEAMGPAASDVELMTTLLEDLNVRGATAFVHLVQNADEFQGAVDDLQNSAGAATEMAEIQQASLEMQIQRVKNALAAPFLLSDEVGKSKGFLNEFSMVLHNVVSELEDLFVVIEDGILVGLTPMGELIKEMAIETLLMFSEIIHDVVIILKRFANEGQGIAGLLHLIATPLTMLVRLFGFLGTDVLQTILTFKILNGILPITNMMQAMNIKTMLTSIATIQAEGVARMGEISTEKAAIGSKVALNGAMRSVIVSQILMKASMFGMIYATQKLANGNKVLAATFGAIAGAIMGMAIAKQTFDITAQTGGWGFAGAVAAGMIAGAAFNVALMDMMTPPDIDYADFDVSELEGRAGGGSVSQSKPYIVGEMGPELFIPNTSGNIIPNSGAGGITINVQGDVYDGDNFANKISEVLPLAYRMLDDKGGFN